jgi:uncharacterized protein (TIGR02466 family)
MSAKIRHMFSTPIMVVDPLISDMRINQQLRQLIMEKRERDPSVQRSNRHGWESSLDFHRWDHPAVRTLQKRLQGMFLHLSASESGQDVNLMELSIYDSALANVGERGAYHIPHIHRNCSWSAVYYVDVPVIDDDPGGELELLDPRTNPIIPGIHSRKRSIKFTPKTGLAVCFPSWLEHWVRPWESDAPRISVAWNATIHQVKILPQPAQPSGESD